MLFIVVALAAPVVVVELALLVGSDPCQVSPVLTILLGGLIVRHGLLPGLDSHVFVFDLLEFFARVSLDLFRLLVGLALLFFLNLQFPLEIPYDLLSNLLLSAQDQLQILISDASRPHVAVLEVAAGHHGWVDIGRAFRR